MTPQHKKIALIGGGLALAAALLYLYLRHRSASSAAPDSSNPGSLPATVASPDGGAGASLLAPTGYGTGTVPTPSSPVDPGTPGPVDTSSPVIGVGGLRTPPRSASTVPAPIGRIIPAPGTSIDNSNYIKSSVGQLEAHAALKAGSVSGAEGVLTGQEKRNFQAEKNAAGERFIGTGPGVSANTSYIDSVVGQSEAAKVAASASASASGTGGILLGLTTKNYQALKNDNDGSQGPPDTSSVPASIDNSVQANQAYLDTSMGQQEQQQVDNSASAQSSGSGGVVESGGSTPNYQAQKESNDSPPPHPPPTPHPPTPPASHSGQTSKNSY